MATKGTVSGVIANMVTLVVDGPVAGNELVGEIEFIAGVAAYTVE